MQIKTTQALPSADLARKLNRFISLCGLIKLCTCTAVNYYSKNDLTNDYTDRVENVSSFKRENENKCAFIPFKQPPPGFDCFVSHFFINNLV